MIDELAIIQNMVQHPIVMVAVLYKVSSEEETWVSFFFFWVAFLHKKSTFLCGPGSFLPHWSKSHFPLFCTSKIIFVGSNQIMVADFFLSVHTSISSCPAWPLREQIHLFPGKYSWLHRQPDFSEFISKFVFVKDHIYNGCCTAPEILPYHSYCSGCTQEGLLFSLTDLRRVVRTLVQRNKSLKYFALVAIFTSCSNRQNTIFHVIHIHFHIAEV